MILLSIKHEFLLIFVTVIEIILNHSDILIVERAKNIQNILETNVENRLFRLIRLKYL